MEEKKELVFPMKFDKCPVCGSTERVAEMVGNELKAAGRMKKEAKIVMFATQTPIVDATGILHSVIAPLLISYGDVCYDCGAYYCTDINKIMAKVDVKPQKMNLPPPPE
jgi:transcription elongation factor Elf1